MMELEVFRFGRILEALRFVLKFGDISCDSNFNALPFKLREKLK